MVERAWDGYASQKNWALDKLAQDATWVLSLDADEWITPELRAEIRRAIGSGRYEGYYMPRWNIFLGRLLKHAWWYPDYQLRLFRPDRGRYEDRLVHEQVQLSGEVGFIESALMHENLKGIDAFLARHIRYAELEAREMLKAKREGLGTQRRGSFFGSWPERRRALKLRVWYRLPARPAIRFLWMYLIKRGFLDGREGRVYCELIASQETLVNAKLLELEQAFRSSGSELDGGLQ